MTAVSDTQRSNPGDDRRARLAARLSREPVAAPILISATWVPHGTPIDSNDPDQVWLCSVDTHELNSWAQRTGTDVNTLHARFRAAVRQHRNPHLGDILTSAEIRTLADAGCLIFTYEVHKAGREITVHFVPPSPAPSNPLETTRTAPIPIQPGGN